MKDYLRRLQRLERLHPPPRRESHADLVERLRPGVAELLAYTGTDPVRLASQVRLVEILQDVRARVEGGHHA